MNVKVKIHSICEENGYSMTKIDVIDNQKLIPSGGLCGSKDLVSVNIKCSLHTYLFERCTNDPIQLGQHWKYKILIFIVLTRNFNNTVF